MPKGRRYNGTAPTRTPRASVLIRQTSNKKGIGITGVWSKVWVGAAYLHREAGSSSLVEVCYDDLMARTELE